jgi:DNA modification methylase
MQGKMAALVMADPPYNVEYKGGSTNENDRADSYKDDMSDAQYTLWLKTLLKNGFDYSDEKSALLLWFASAKMRCIMDGFEGAGWDARTLIVWNKLKAHYGALGAQYKHKYEPMWYCYKRGKSPRFFGATNETTVWDFEQPRVNDLHPTMKPIELYERCVKNHTERNDIVVELFSGSGTTIVACERLGRKARAVEKLPKFVAVAIQRWVDMTGGTPELIYNGESTNG